jgi:hypothetical protein
MRSTSCRRSYTHFAQLGLRKARYLTVFVVACHSGRNLMSLRVVGLGVIAAALPACAGPELAPLWQLEQGCHVWFDDGSGHGVSSSIGGTESTIEAGDSSLDGPSLVGSGDIAFRNKTFARFDGSTLSIEPLGLFSTECVGAIDRTSNVIHLEGGRRPLDLQRSKACTPPQAALGAAALYLARFDADRHNAIALNHHSSFSRP